MRYRIVDSDGNTCDGACNDCSDRDECEEYIDNGERCLRACEEGCETCYCWSGGCEGRA